MRFAMKIASLRFEAATVYLVDAIGDNLDGLQITVAVGVELALIHMAGDFLVLLVCHPLASSLFAFAQE